MKLKERNGEMGQVGRETLLRQTPLHVPVAAPAEGESPPPLG